MITIQGTEVHSSRRRLQRLLLHACASLEGFSNSKWYGLTEVAWFLTPADVLMVMIAPRSGIELEPRSPCFAGQLCLSEIQSLLDSPCTLAKIPYW